MLLFCEITYNFPR